MNEGSGALGHGPGAVNEAWVFPGLHRANLVGAARRVKPPLSPPRRADIPVRSQVRLPERPVKFAALGAVGALLRTGMSARRWPKPDARRPPALPRLFLPSPASAALIASQGLELSLIHI